MRGPLELRPDGALWLYLKVMPKSRKAVLRGVEADGRGIRRLKAAVTAPPEDVKANHELLKMLAKNLRIPFSSLTLVSGESARMKCVAIAAADADQAHSALDAVLADAMRAVFQ